MKNAEYQGNLSCPQRASAEHEGDAGAQSVGSREVKEQGGADLLERILSRDNLNRAYKRVKANKGAPGIDGMTVEQALPWLREHREELLDMIRQGKYKPQPVRRKEIPKPDGGVRKLGIPTVVDRIIQQAIAEKPTGTWSEMAMCSEQSQQKDLHRPDTTVSLTSTSLCTYAIEPTCTERYVSLSNEACKNLEIAPVQTY